MQKQHERLLMLIMVSALMTACPYILSPFLRGGDVVPANYKPRKILVRYHFVGYPTGADPAGSEVYLIETSEAIAIWEKGKNRGSIITNHWQEDDGDHFAAWASEKYPAIEYVIPFDRTRAAYRFIYTPRSYKILKINGVNRPVSNFDRKNRDYVFLHVLLPE